SIARRAFTDQPVSLLGYQIRHPANQEKNFTEGLEVLEEEYGYDIYQIFSLLRRVRERPGLGQLLSEEIDQQARFLITMVISEG
ncbi:hypothetical protein HKBW3S42_02342, partial [Candidatus Hakubella thermalkaliphila]